MNQPGKRKLRLSMPGNFSHFCHTKQIETEYMTIAEAMEISPENILRRSARNENADRGE